MAEVLKLLSGYSQTVENELGMRAGEGNNIETQPIQRRPDCYACAHNPSAVLKLPSKSKSTLGALLEKLDAQLQLKEPSVGIPGQVPWTRPDDLQANSALTLEALLEGYTGPLSLTHAIFGRGQGKGLQVQYEGP